MAWERAVQLCGSTKWKSCTCWFLRRSAETAASNAHRGPVRSRTRSGPESPNVPAAARVAPEGPHARKGWNREARRRASRFRRRELPRSGLESLRKRQSFPTSWGSPALGWSPMLRKPKPRRRSRPSACSWSLACVPAAAARVRGSDRARARFRSSSAGFCRWFRNVEISPRSVAWVKPRIARHQRACSLRLSVHSGSRPDRQTGSVAFLA